MIAHTGKARRRRRVLLSREANWTLLFLFVGLFGLMMLYSRPPAPDPSPHLTRILARGELIVATRNGPTSYFIGPQGETGLEYDLAVRFAERLGVRLRMEPVGHLSDLFAAIRSGRADIAAAGLTVTPARRQFVRFGPSYMQAAPIVVYRSNRDRPTRPEDLVGMKLTVLASSSYEELLQSIQQVVPDLRWESTHHADVELVLESIEAGQYDATVVDSNVFDIHRRFYPNLRRAFDLGAVRDLAWALPPGDDTSLIAAAEAFFGRLQNDGTLARLKRRYYGLVNEFAQVETLEFLRNIENRLPALAEDFKAAARETGLDWTLLAAMGYQESHWRADAVSPTGVRGIMMLTRRTAAQMGISNRSDPAQSIAGGARYFRRLLDRIPQRIKEPDRTWMALAAYNIGFGHLEDARVLTQRYGHDPDRWTEVARHLPLLSQQEHFETVRYGYARGREPVRYVENIRSYQDILVWTLRRNPDLLLGTATPQQTTATVAPRRSREDAPETTTMGPQPRDR